MCPMVRYASTGPVSVQPSHPGLGQRKQKLITISHEHTEMDHDGVLELPRGSGVGPSRDELGKLGPDNLMGPGCLINNRGRSTSLTHDLVSDSSVPLPIVLGTDHFLLNGRCPSCPNICGDSGDWKRNGMPEDHFLWSIPNAGPAFFPAGWNNQLIKWPKEHTGNWLN